MYTGNCKVLFLQAFMYVTNQIYFHSQCRALRLHLSKDQYFFSRTCLCIYTYKLLCDKAMITSLKQNWFPILKKIFPFLPRIWDFNPHTTEVLKQKHFFKYQVIKWWNSFPQAIMETKSTNQFIKDFNKFFENRLTVGYWK